MANNSGLNGLYRPRSALARALYEKQRNDRHLQEFDQNEWYRVDKSRVNEELQQKFVQLEPDDETKEFLSNSIDKSSWVWTQIWYLLAKAVLKHFWTTTDINGSNFMQFSRK
ncbi:protein-L-histidine N-pros-methyltransferase-like [Melitaea cinxia]|uniref:protein-L-histidine N-pros-methyltransferase-like n=1 Tax=Melitaea cinxia TaxID=113334 RepID=UPI001E271D6B|nr:protein-L-histidine N-pros-methyltransferase-like [Melitaea cinxia]